MATKGREQTDRWWFLPAATSHPELHNMVSTSVSTVPATNGQSKLCGGVFLKFFFHLFFILFFCLNTLTSLHLFNFLPSLCSAFSSFFFCSFLCSSCVLTSYLLERGNVTLLSKVSQSVVSFLVQKLLCNKPGILLSVVFWLLSFCFYSTFDVVIVSFLCLMWFLTASKEFFCCFFLRELLFRVHLVSSAPLPPIYWYIVFICFCLCFFCFILFVQVCVKGLCKLFHIALKMSVQSENEWWLRGWLAVLFPAVTVFCLWNPHILLLFL